MPKPSAYQKALALLARREHSVRELTFKLLHKDYLSHEVEQAVQRLKQENYLNEHRFIGCIIRARVAQGAGPLKIIHELQSHELTQAAVMAHEEWSEVDWGRLAQQVRVKHFGAQPPIDAKQKAKQMQFLQRRGFQHDEIRSAFDVIEINEENPVSFLPT